MQGWGEYGPKLEDQLGGHGSRRGDDGFDQDDDGRVSERWLGTCHRYL